MSTNAHLLNPDEAAKIIGVSKGWVYRHAAELPVVRLGDGLNAPIRIDPNDLRAWLLASGRAAKRTLRTDAARLRMLAADDGEDDGEHELPVPEIGVTP
jgi:hypothetical protein